MKEIVVTFGMDIFIRARRWYRQLIISVDTEGIGTDRLWLCGMCHECWSDWPEKSITTWWSYEPVDRYFLQTFDTVGFNTLFFCCNFQIARIQILLQTAMKSTHKKPNRFKCLCISMSNVHPFALVFSVILFSFALYVQFTREHILVAHCSVLISDHVKPLTIIHLWIKLEYSFLYSLILCLTKLHEYSASREHNKKYRSKPEQSFTEYSLPFLLFACV